MHLIKRPGLAILILLLQLLSCQKESKQSSSTLQVFDPSLRLELIAESPTIQTPIGIAINNQDEIFVLESHTHSPQKDYPGPMYDRIKKGIDHDQDGTPEDWIVYADSIEDGMNLTIDDTGKVYLATKNSVHVYADLDSDGRSDTHEILLKMSPPENVYDHAGILGIAIGQGDWIYVSRGNTGSQHWLITGTDGQSIEGYGDGGNIFRCRKDGSQVEELATGFWNPFDIKFTGEGRLLATDNDPDSRGPNRLLEIVPGGHYGYQSLYGGSGLHPYLAWNGELPGTLPYAAPLGEAPCALIDAASTNFGADYSNQILVNIWEENNVVRIPMQTQGSTIAGEPVVFIQGDSTFHPVGLATNSQGDLYITDWVVRQYPNHGRGRIWKVSSQKKESSEVVVTDKAINRFRPSDSTENLILALTDEDPFRRAEAHFWLKKSQELPFENLLNSQNPASQLAGLTIALHEKKLIPKNQLSAFLKHQQPEIQKMAMIYTGTLHQRDLLSELQSLLDNGLSPDLFETYLATIRHLQPEFIKLVQEKGKSQANKIKRSLPKGYLFQLIQNPSISEASRSLALPYLENPDDHQDQLLKLLKASKNPDFQIALIKTLQTINNQKIGEAFLTILEQKASPLSVRLQALLALSYQSKNYADKILPLVNSDSSEIAQVALRYLCLHQNQTELPITLEELSEDETKKALFEIWSICTDPGPTPKILNGSGNPLLGKIVFESPHAQCTNCHKVNGWGGILGPDLSHVGSSKSRSQLIRSVLYPSIDIAPDWQGWYVIDSSGTSHYGRQIDVHLNNVELMTEAGTFEKFVKPKSYGVLENSLMPDGLRDLLSSSECSDLIAYLESLR